MPVASSIQWKPLRDSHYVVASLQPGGGGLRHIFARQSILREVQALARADPERPVVGLLLGRRFDCSLTLTPYVLIESHVEVALAWLDERAISDAIRTLLRHVGQRNRVDVLGWFCSSRSTNGAISPTVASAHAACFPEPWQTVLTVGAGGDTGAFFLHDSRAARWFHAPFYEVTESKAPSRAPKPTCVAWPAYLTTASVVPLAETARPVALTLPRTIVTGPVSPSLMPLRQHSVAPARPVVRVRRTPARDAIVGMGRAAATARRSTLDLAKTIGGMAAIGAGIAARWAVATSRHAAEEIGRVRAEWAASAAQRKAEADAARARESERRAKEAADRRAAHEEAQRRAAEAEKRRAAEAAARRAAQAEARRKAAEEAEQRRAEEAEARRQAAEAEARRRAEEEAEARRRAAEAEARRRAAEAEARRQAAEAEARRRTEEAEAEARRRAEEVKARLAAEAEARRRAEEARLAAEAEARRRAEEARLAAEAEARRKAAEEAEQRRAEEAAARRQAAEAEARRRTEEAEAEARRRAEEVKARLAAEAEAQRKAAEEMEARRAAEAEAQRKAAEDAQRRASEAEARRKTAEEAQRKAAEEERRRAAAAAARRHAAAEADAQRQAAEAEARRLFEEEAQRLAAEIEAPRLADEAEAESRRKAAEAEDAARLMAAEAEALRISVEVAALRERLARPPVEGSKREASKVAAPRMADLEDTTLNDAPYRYLALACREGFELSERIDRGTPVHPETVWLLYERESGLRLIVVTIGDHVREASLHYNLRTDDDSLLQMTAPEHRDVDSHTIYGREECLHNLRARCRRLRATKALERDWRVSPTFQPSESRL